MVGACQRALRPAFVDLRNLRVRVRDHGLSRIEVIRAPCGARTGFHSRELQRAHLRRADLRASIASGFAGTGVRRTLAFALMLAFAAPSLASAGERWNLQQPVVPESKLHCRTPQCLSLSTTVRVSDACWRTCRAHCGGVLVACVNDNWLNDCRYVSDRCDLSCLKHCRAYGGPLLDLTD